MIKKITSQQTIYVRKAVLRQGKPIETCVFDGDDLPTTTHFGYFVDKNIVGILSIYRNKNGIFDAEFQHQFRGMAVLDSHQNKGIGKALVLHAENWLSNNNAELIWMNARIKAVPFYENLGYKTSGNSFEIPEIGAHYLMYRKI